MVSRSIRLVVLVLAAGILAGCYDASDPDVYPLRLEFVRSASEHQQFADLDGDGRDEMMRLTAHAEKFGHVGLHLQRLNGTSIEQVNFATSYRFVPENRLHTLDLDGDGRLEVLVPLVQGDSLVVRAYDAEARFVRELFLATGEPRRVPGGELAWDPVVSAFFLEDVQSDGHPEFITVLRTGYARYPRGVLAHDLRTGELVGEWGTGASLDGVEIKDFDGDGRREVLFESGASRNGAKAGRLSDDRAHVGVVDLQVPMSLRWSITGDRKRFSGMVAEIMDGDQGHVLVVETIATSRPGPTSVRVVDAAQGAIVTEKVWPYGMARAMTNHGGAAFLLDMRGWLSTVDDALNVIAEREVDGYLAGAVDIDGDGRREAHLWLRGPGLHMFLNEELDVQAVLEGGAAAFTTVQQGAAQVPLVAMQTSTAPYTHLGRAVANPLWWLHRYGPGGALSLGLLVLVGLTVSGVQRTRRRRLAEAVSERVLAGDDRGFVLLDPGGRVAEANPAFRQRFGLDGEANADLRRALGARAPALEAFIAALPEGPLHRCEAAVEAGGDDAPPAWVVAEPLEVERRGRPHWLVSVMPAPVERVVGDETWPLLARRVVHDLKNPLTSILLTLQRMQMEAHAHAPEGVAARLDPYVERVEGRVEHLRRMTQNLLKFLDAAQPELAEADLCAMVEGAVEGLRPAMPPDVRLELLRCSEPVRVLADEEQVTSALENLAMNAVQAMPDGGRVTVQARVARRLQPEGVPAPRDYAVLEVLDTGRGMDAEARRRAFKPGFTTRDGGTGLGLGLVQKVVRDHGGFVEVESEPGAGTAVCLHFPLYVGAGFADAESADAQRETQTPEDPTAPRDAAAA